MCVCRHQVLLTVAKEEVVNDAFTQAEKLQVEVLVQVSMETEKKHTDFLFYFLYYRSDS